jgi:cytochrome c oxidase cbb3-type subunit 3
MRTVALAAAAAGLLSLPTAHAWSQQPAPPAVRYQGHVPAGGRQPPADSLRNPFPPGAGTIEEGRKLFEGLNCVGCHSGGAVGGMGPSLADGRWRYGGSDGEILHSILYGRARGMPAFGGSVPTAAIWKIVTYLQSLAPARDTVATVAW